MKKILLTLILVLTINIVLPEPPNMVGKLVRGIIIEPITYNKAYFNTSREEFIAVILNNSKKDSIASMKLLDSLQFKWIEVILFNDNQILIL